jgi:hypothetical protein
MSSGSITQYAIYDHPADFPDGYVVRTWLIEAGQVQAGEARTAATLEEARALIPPGTELIENVYEDDPKIIEVWM